MNTFIKSIQQNPRVISIRQTALAIRIRQSALVKSLRKALFNETETTIVDLIDQVIVDFKILMKRNSGRQTIQFPMVFDILLCPQDYQSFEQSIYGAFDEIIRNCYYYIKEKRDSITGSVVNAMNKYWLFRFGECPATIKINGKEKIPTPGKILTIASFISDDLLNGSQQGEGQKNGVRKTGTNTRSSFAGKAINLEFLRGGVLLPNNTAVFMFDPELSRVIPVKTNNGFASITWRSLMSSRESKQPFIMKESPITISGPKREGEGSAFVMIIEDNKLEKDHIQIRYSEEGRQFQICAYADGVVVDEMPIPISKSDSPNWKPLPKDSEIIIRNSVSIAFKAL